MVVTEVWLHPELSDGELLPSGYKMVTKDRETRQGGVAHIPKNNSEYVVTEGFQNVESIWYKINFYNTHYVICTFYGPSDAPIPVLEAVHD